MYTWEEYEKLWLRVKKGFFNKPFPASFKLDCEDLINNCPLLYISNEESLALCENDYKTEERKFIDILYEYFTNLVYKAQKDGLTFTKTVKDCIKAYMPEKGAFLNYLMVSLSKRLKIEEGQESVSDKRNGIKVSRNDDRDLRRIINYVRETLMLSLDDFFRSESLQEDVALDLDMPYERLKKLVVLNNSSTTISNQVLTNDRDEYYDLFNGLLAESLGLSIAKSSNLESQEETAWELDEKRDKLDSFKERILYIEQVYNKEKNGLPIAMLLTAEMIKDLEYNISYVEEVLDGVEFRNQRVIDYFVRNNKVPTARQISARLGMSENALSNKYRRFKEKL